MFVRPFALAMVFASIWCQWSWPSHERGKDKMLGKESDADLPSNGPPTIEDAPRLSSTLYPTLSQSADSLRLLILAPGTSEVIECRTEATTFSQYPRYRALSYEWGPPEPTGLVRINGIRIRVRRNLWLALFNLRHPTTEVTLWTDAICINQQDLAEKAKLIPQMSMIYRRAEEVVVWLDNRDAPDTVKANLHQIAKWQSSPKVINLSYHPLWWDEAVPWFYQLIRAQYWERTWIVQEIVEAVRLSVHFGDCSLPWEAFISTVHTLRNVFPSLAGFDKVDNIKRLRDAKQAGEIYDLADLVCQFRDTFCQMPQDKLYAFLGMADDDSASSIAAAYDRSLTDVYADFVEYLSESPIDPVSKEIQIIHRSALMRYLLVGKAGQVVERELRPCIKHKNLEPYVRHILTKYLFTERITKFLDQGSGRWVEWDLCAAEHKVSCWLPVASEQFETWTVDRSWSEGGIQVRGLLIGHIEYLGPTVEAFLRSAHVVKQWKISVREHFSHQPFQKKMMALCERITDVVGLSSMENSISSIGSFCSSSGRSQHNSSARVFIASNGILGLATPTAHVGDSIVQFWNSTSSTILRPDHDADHNTEMEIIGRAGIVREGYSHDWDILEDMDVFQNTAEPNPRGSVLSLHMDINTLTQLTLNSIRLNDGAYHPKCQPLTPVIPPSPGSVQDARIWTHLLVPFIVSFTVFFWLEGISFDPY